ncbi:hypothetical protein CSUI_003218 [Cystoisospora suis]|uniref:Uncharacterized protein n=1 Tax=Cystoisospora suis TaxID=483139 RepID=A0A2C6KR64_9APIC|nr:hypothetical protein CSUI_003218 [Cystoisospora suis]
MSFYLPPPPTPVLLAFEKKKLLRQQQRQRQRSKQHEEASLLPSSRNRKSSSSSHRGSCMSRSSSSQPPAFSSATPPLLHPSSSSSSSRSSLLHTDRLPLEIAATSQDNSHVSLTKGSRKEYTVRKPPSSSFSSSATSARPSSSTTTVAELLADHTGKRRLSFQDKKERKGKGGRGRTASKSDNKTRCHIVLPEKNRPFRSLSPHESSHSPSQERVEKTGEEAVVSAAHQSSSAPFLTISSIARREEEEAKHRKVHKKGSAQPPKVSDEHEVRRRSRSTSGKRGGGGGPADVFSLLIPSTGNMSVLSRNHKTSSKSHIDGEEEEERDEEGKEKQDLLPTVQGGGKRGSRKRLRSKDDSKSSDTRRKLNLEEEEDGNAVEQEEEEDEPSQGLSLSKKRTAPSNCHPKQPVNGLHESCTEAGGRDNPGGARKNKEKQIKTRRREESTGEAGEVLLSPPSAVVSEKDLREKTVRRNEEENENGFLQKPSKTPSSKVDISLIKTKARDNTKEEKEAYSVLTMKQQKDGQDDPGVGHYFIGVVDSQSLKTSKKSRTKEKRDNKENGEAVARGEGEAGGGGGKEGRGGRDSFLMVETRKIDHGLKSRARQVGVREGREGREGIMGLSVEEDDFIEKEGKARRRGREKEKKGIVIRKDEGGRGAEAYTTRTGRSPGDNRRYLSSSSLSSPNLTMRSSPTRRPRHHRHHHSSSSPSSSPSSPLRSTAKAAQSVLSASASMTVPVSPGSLYVKRPHPLPGLPTSSSSPLRLRRGLRGGEGEKEERSLRVRSPHKTREEIVSRRFYRPHAHKHHTSHGGSYASSSSSPLLHRSRVRSSLLRKRSSSSPIGEHTTHLPTMKGGGGEREMRTEEATPLRGTHEGDDRRRRGSSPSSRRKERVGYSSGSPVPSSRRDHSTGVKRLSTIEEERYLGRSDVETRAVERGREEEEEQELMVETEEEEEGHGRDDRGGEGADRKRGERRRYREISGGEVREYVMESEGEEEEDEEEKDSLLGDQQISEDVRREGASITSHKDNSLLRSIDKRERRRRRNGGSTRIEEDHHHHDDVDDEVYIHPEDAEHHRYIYYRKGGGTGKKSRRPGLRRTSKHVLSSKKLIFSLDHPHSSRHLLNSSLDRSRELQAKKMYTTTSPLKSPRRQNPLPHHTSSTSSSSFSPSKILAPRGLSSYSSEGITLAQANDPPDKPHKENIPMNRPIGPNRLHSVSPSRSSSSSFSSSMNILARTPPSSSSSFLCGSTQEGLPSHAVNTLQGPLMPFPSSVRYAPSNSSPHKLVSLKTSSPRKILSQIHSDVTGMSHASSPLRSRGLIAPIGKGDDPEVRCPSSKSLRVSGRGGEEASSSSLHGDPSTRGGVASLHSLCIGDIPFTGNTTGSSTRSTTTTTMMMARSLDNSIDMSSVSDRGRKIEEENLPLQGQGGTSSSSFSPYSSRHRHARPTSKGALRDAPRSLLPSVIEEEPQEKRSRKTSTSNSRRGDAPESHHRREEPGKITGGDSEGIIEEKEDGGERRRRRGGGGDVFQENRRSPPRLLHPSHSSHEEEPSSHEISQQDDPCRSTITATGEMPSKAPHPGAPLLPEMRARRHSLGGVRKTHQQQTYSSSSSTALDAERGESSRIRTYDWESSEERREGKGEVFHHNRMASVPAPSLHLQQLHMDKGVRINRELMRFNALEARIVVSERSTTQTNAGVMGKIPEEEKKRRMPSLGGEAGRGLGEDDEEKKRLLLLASCEESNREGERQLVQEERNTEVERERESLENAAREKRRQGKDENPIALEEEGEDKEEKGEKNGDEKEKNRCSDHSSTSYNRCSKRSPHTGEDRLLPQPPVTPDCATVLLQQKRDKEKRRLERKKRQQALLKEKESKLSADDNDGSPLPPPPADPASFAFYWLNHSPTLERERKREGEEGEARREGGDQDHKRSMNLPNPDVSASSSSSSSSGSSSSTSSLTFFVEDKENLQNFSSASEQVDNPFNRSKNLSPDPLSFSASSRDDLIMKGRIRREKDMKGNLSPVTKRGPPPLPPPPSSPPRAVVPTIDGDRRRFTRDRHLYKGIVHEGEANHRHPSESDGTGGNALQKFQGGIGDRGVGTRSVGSTAATSANTEMSLETSSSGLTSGGRLHDPSTSSSSSSRFIPNHNTLVGKTFEERGGEGYLPPPSSLSLSSPLRPSGLLNYQAPRQGDENVGEINRRNFSLHHSLTLSDSERTATRMLPLDERDNKATEGGLFLSPFFPSSNREDERKKEVEVDMMEANQKMRRSHEGGLARRGEEGGSSSFSASAKRHSSLVEASSSLLLTPTFPLPPSFSACPPSSPSPIVPPAPLSSSHHSQASFSSPHLYTSAGAVFSSSSRTSPSYADISQASSEKNKTVHASSPSVPHTEVLSPYLPSNSTHTGIPIGRGGGERVEAQIEWSSKERDLWMKAIASEALRSRASSIRVKLPVPAPPPFSSSSHIEGDGIGGDGGEEEDDEGDILVEENDNDERREAYYREEASRQIFTGVQNFLSYLSSPSSSPESFPTFSSLSFSSSSFPLPSLRELLRLLSPPRHLPGGQEKEEGDHSKSVLHALGIPKPPASSSSFSSSLPVSGRTSSEKNPPEVHIFTAFFLPLLKAAERATARSELEKVVATFPLTAGCSDTRRDILVAFAERVAKSAVREIRRHFGQFAVYIHRRAQWLLEEHQARVAHRQKQLALRREEELDLSHHLYVCRDRWTYIGGNGTLSASLPHGKRLQDVRIAHEILQLQEKPQEHAGLLKRSMEIEGLPYDNDQHTQDIPGNLPTATSPLPHDDPTVPAGSVAGAPPALKPPGGDLSSSDASGQTGVSSIGEPREKEKGQEGEEGLHEERRGEGDKEQTSEKNVVNSHAWDHENGEGKKEIEVEEDLLHLSKDEEDLLLKKRTVSQIKEDLMRCDDGETRRIEEEEKAKALLTRRRYLRRLRVELFIIRTIESFLSLERLHEGISRGKQMLEALEYQKRQVLMMAQVLHRVVLPRVDDKQLLLQLQGKARRRSSSASSSTAPTGEEEEETSFGTFLPFYKSRLLLRSLPSSYLSLLPSFLLRSSSSFSFFLSFSLFLSSFSRTSFSFFLSHSFFLFVFCMQITLLNGQHLTSGIGGASCSSSSPREEKRQLPEEEEDGEQDLSRRLTLLSSLSHEEKKSFANPDLIGDQERSHSSPALANIEKCEGESILKPSSSVKRVTYMREGKKDKAEDEEREKKSHTLSRDFEGRSRKKSGGEDRTTRRKGEKSDGESPPPRGFLPLLQSPRLKNLLPSLLVDHLPPLPPSRRFSLASLMGERSVRAGEEDEELTSSSSRRSSSSSGVGSLQLPLEGEDEEEASLRKRHGEKVGLDHFLLSKKPLQKGDCLLDVDEEVKEDKEKEREGKNNKRKEDVWLSEDRDRGDSEGLEGKEEEERFPRHAFGSFSLHPSLKEMHAEVLAVGEGEGRGVREAPIGQPLTLSDLRSNHEDDEMEEEEEEEMEKPQKIPGEEEHIMEVLSRKTSEGMAKRRKNEENKMERNDNFEDPGRKHSRTSEALLKEKEGRKQGDDLLDFSKTSSSLNDTTIKLSTEKRHPSPSQNHREASGVTTAQGYTPRSHSRPRNLPSSHRRALPSSSLVLLSSSSSSSSSCFTPSRSPPLMMGNRRREEKEDEEKGEQEKRKVSERAKTNYVLQRIDPRSSSSTSFAAPAIMRDASIALTKAKKRSGREDTTEEEEEKKKKKSMDTKSKTSYEEGENKKGYRNVEETLLSTGKGRGGIFNRNMLGTSQTFPSSLGEGGEAGRQESRRRREEEESFCLRSLASSRRR